MQPGSAAISSGRLRSSTKRETYVIEPALTARVRHLRGHVATQRGPIADAPSLFVEAAEGIADADPELAVTMLADAAVANLYAGDTPAIASVAARAGELAEGLDSDRARFFAAMAEGLARVAAGEGEAGAAAVRRAVAVLEGSAELREDPRLRVWSAIGPLWLRETEGRS